MILRVKGGKLVLDLRTVLPGQDDLLLEALIAVLDETTLKEEGN